MGRGLKVLLVAVGVIGLGVTLVTAFQGQIALWLMAGVVERNMAADPLAALSEGLHVGLCGAGAPLPDPSRGGPCAIVVAKQGTDVQTYVVDAGTGGVRTLAQMGLPVGEIDGVFLTHFHSDHIDGLGELAMQRWVNRMATSPLPLIGPAGVERVADGFNQAYAQDFVYRTAHHGADIVPPSGAGLEAVPFAEPQDGVDAVVLEQDGLRVTAILVDHTPVAPAVGYRFDFLGRSIVISGDTVKSGNLQRAAEGADLMLHEALAPQLVDVITQAAAKAGRANIEKITLDILDYHTTPVEAAELAQGAGVKMLVFHHIVPALPLAALESVFVEGVSDAYDGPVHVAVDGDFWSLPAGSDAIHHEERL